MTDGPIASNSSRCYQVTHRTVYRYSDVVTSSFTVFLTKKTSSPTKAQWRDEHDSQPQTQQAKVTADQHQPST